MPFRATSEVSPSLNVQRKIISLYIARVLWQSRRRVVSGDLRYCIAASCLAFVFVTTYTRLLATRPLRLRLPTRYPRAPPLRYPAIDYFYVVAYEIFRDRIFLRGYADPFRKASGRRNRTRSNLLKRLTKMGARYI